MIENGSQVKLHLVLAIDEEIIDNTEIEYTHGEGGLLGGLQEQLLGMEVGEKKECTVPPEKAYGERNDDALLRVPPQLFGDDLSALKVGSIVHGTFDEVTCDAQITEIQEESIVLDMNHPLAGKTLQFAVEVLAVQPPQ
jgi:FKBP-type peptidyl-prolyl cis-trans isomerase SlyD